MAELSFLFASVQSDKPRPVTRLAYTQPRGAPGAGDFVRLTFKTGPQGRFLNGRPGETGFSGGLDFFLGFAGLILQRRFP